MVKGRTPLLGRDIFIKNVDALSRGMRRRGRSRELADAGSWGEEPTVDKVSERDSNSNTVIWESMSMKYVHRFPLAKTGIIIS